MRVRLQASILVQVVILEGNGKYIYVEKNDSKNALRCLKARSKNIHRNNA